MLFQKSYIVKHYSFRPKTKVERGSVHYMAAGCKAFLKLNRSQKRFGRLTALFLRRMMLNQKEEGGTSINRK